MTRTLHKCLKNKLIAGLSALLCFVAIACNKESGDPQSCEEFDRTEMLTNLSENVIQPSYQGLALLVGSLESSTDSFANNPDLTNLTLLKNTFWEAYKLYQSASIFEFGPAETKLLRATFNTFPTDTLQINSNVSTGIYDLASGANADAKGFPAIDYLLFEEINDTTLLEAFTTSPNASNRLTYLKDLVSELSTLMNFVVQEWQGSYSSDFISNTGTDIGSSIGLLVNQLSFDLELLKNARIGIPAGKKTLNIPIPEKVEAFYHGGSLELAILHLAQLERIYLGQSSLGMNKSGLDDYLTFLGAQKNGGSLNDAIKSQFTSALAELHAIPNPLSDAVTSNVALVDAAYLELQKLVVLLKTDMTSALGVQITYQDNDGD